MSWVNVSEELLNESRDLNAKIEQVLGAIPPMYTVDPQVQRAQRIDGTGVLPKPVYMDECRNRTIHGPAGDINLRVFVPEKIDGVYLHIHGGGWVLGAADQQDQLLQMLGLTANLAAVSVEYRLAPEHPYPAGPDDCEAAACWLVENAKREFGADRLLIGGESAGAHLSALTLLRMRDRHGAAKHFSGANLVFGAYDLGMTPSQRNWGVRNLVLSTPIMQWFYDQFTPGWSVEQRRDPQVSPLWADLHGMPPALFTVGALDPLLDDNLFMAARWQAAGNHAELQIFPESIHGFHAFPTGIAQLMIQAQLTFVKQTLSGDPRTA
ncbi:MAG: alpha/beta hydrolase [Deltaproteobacteria bacterium]|nr:alpha/beta hydrolase [Deltaproteobacteria bacterium]